MASQQPVSHEPNLLHTTEDSTQHTCMVLQKSKVVFEEEQLSLLDRVDPIIPEYVCREYMDLYTSSKQVVEFIEEVGSSDQNYC